MPLRLRRKGGRSREGGEGGEEKRDGFGLLGDRGGVRLPWTSLFIGRQGPSSAFLLATPPAIAQFGRNITNTCPSRLTRLGHAIPLSLRCTCNLELAVASSMWLEGPRRPECRRKLAACPGPDPR